MRVTPWHQTNWDWRAAANFIGGGTGTGLMFFALFATDTPATYRVMAGIALLLVAAGLSCVWAEIGRPWRALNVFLHPQTSWMTREGMVAPFYFGSGAVAIWQGGGDGMFAPIAAALGILFLYCQGRILAASKGIPAWREPKIIPLILATGFVEGAGLAALLFFLLPAPAAMPGWLVGLLLGALILRRLAWKMYSEALVRQGAPQKALAVLRNFGARFEKFGQLLPEMMLLATLLVGDASGAMPLLVALAGGAALIAGWALKFTIVARAAYNQGFALPVLPVRGQGSKTPGTKPGWSK